MKITTISIVAILVLTLSVCCLVGCNVGSKSNRLSFEKSMNYSVIGGIGLLNGSSASRVSSMVDDSSSRAVLLADAPASSFTQEEKDEFIRNLTIAQSTINNGVIKEDTKPSDRPEYEIHYTITTTDITGESKTYAFYYNVVEGVVDELDDDDDKDEQEVHIKGIVILDGEEYQLTGDKEIEGEGVDQEIEITFNIKMDNDKFVVIEQETEMNEQEFSYGLYENGKLVSKSEVEYEQEENGALELSFFSKNGNKKMEYSYEFVTTNEGKFVKIKFKETANVNRKALIKIVEDEATGEISYEFIEQNNSTGNK